MVRESTDGYINIWNPNNGKLNSKLTGNDIFNSLVESPNGFLVSSKGSTINIWNSNIRSLIKTQAPAKGLFSKSIVSIVSLIAFKDGSLAICTLDNLIHIWSPHCNQIKNK